MKRDFKQKPYNTVLRQLFMGIFLLVFALSAQAQSKSVTGQVLDDNGLPLPGVSIAIKGTKTGTQSDFNGGFKITASAKDQLVFSYIGFETKTVTIGNSSNLNVSLHETASNLDEVLVIGYGTVKRKDVTGSVSRVDMVDLNKAPVRSFEEALAGRVAGVQVTSSDGRPGSDVEIVIRGNNSVTQANSPLYVIDGFPIEDANNNTVNPADIESIDILKDASATAIYGARGANGVVVITTKQGKAGKPVFSFNSFTGVQNILNKMPVMDPYQYVNYQIEFDPTVTAAPGQTKTPTQIYLTEPGRTLDYYKTVQPIDWQDLTSRIGMIKNNDFSIRGGTKKLKYSFSGSANNQDGVLLNSEYQRYQGRVNLDYTFNSKFKVGINTNYSNLEQSGQDPTRGDNGATTNVMVSIWGYRPVPSEDYSLVDEFQDPDLNTGNDYRINPVLSLENTYIVNKTKNIIANGYLEYSIVKNLKLRSSFGITENRVDGYQFYNSNTSYGRPGSVNGVNGRLNNTNYSNWLNENTVTWNKQLTKKSKLNAVGGFTLQQRKTWYNGRFVTQLPNEDKMFDGFDDPGAIEQVVVPTNSIWTMASFLGRVNYNYASKYLLTVSFRADGSSKFPSQNHWGYFPSAAASWKFNEEKFLKKSKTLSDGKLRVSYGVTGNNRVGDFDYVTNFFNPIINTYVFNNEYVSGVVPTKIGNSDLKWESTTQVDAGLDLGFFKQKIIFTADVYQKTTKDLLLNAQLPLSSGFTTAIKNIGSVENKGLELTLTTKNIETKDFSWTSSANISFNKNKLVALDEGQSDLQSVVNWDTQWRTTSAYISKVGEPLGLMYGYESLGTYKYDDFNQTVNGSGATVYTLKDGVATNGNTRGSIQPGDIKYKDQNGDLVVDASDYTVIGHGAPKHIGGFSNNFTYKGFDLGIFFQWSYGNDIMNANRLLFDGNTKSQGSLNQFASYENRWTPENPDSNVFRTRGYFGGGYSSNFVEDGSYLRLKTVSLGYDLDNDFVKRIHLKSLRFYVSGQNLFTWTKYSGPDPEVNTYSSALTPGFDFSAYPRARTIAFGTNIQF